MLKKIILSSLLIIISFFFTNINPTTYSYTWDKQNDISSTWFTIHVKELSPWWNSIFTQIKVADTPKDTMLNILALIIENLMVAIWVVAILVMTIWWGYMIMYVWQDDMLSKWKSIFKSWLLALIAALWSWLLVKLVAFLLY